MESNRVSVLDVSVKPLSGGVSPRLLLPLLLGLLLLLFLSCTDAKGGPTPLPYTGVAFLSTDGTPLVGRIYGTGQVAVVMAHMYPSDQDGWADFAEELAKKDFTAFTFNFRGYGSSGGDKDITKIDQDLAAAVAEVRRRGAQQVFLVGASMGGTAALKVAAQDQVAGVVTLSAPVVFQGLDASSAVVRLSEPKLFLASEEDAEAAQNQAWLFEMAPEPREQRLFPGSAHGTDMLQKPYGSQVRAAILDFIQRQITKNGSP